MIKRMQLKPCIIIIALLLTAAGMLSPGQAAAQDFYWESEEVLIDGNASFAASASGGGFIASVWQEITNESEEGGEFFLSTVSTGDGLNWTENNRFLGPFSYTGSASYFYSFIIDDSGKMILAVSNDDNTVSIYSSRDRGGRFTKLHTSEAFPVRVSPRLSLRSDGGMLLFVTQESADENFGSLGIYYSVSENGRYWTEYKPLAPETELTGNFLPSHTSYRGRDYVVFQAFNLGDMSTFQLYLKYSDDGGISWSDPRYLSGFEDENDFYDGNPYVFDNQRPFLLGTDVGLSLTWERSYSGGNPQIYFAEIGYDGRISGQPEQVSRGASECRNPRLSWFNGNNYIIWFDNRVGDYHNIMAEKDGLFWSDTDLNYITPGSSIFGNLLVNGGDMYVMWENEYRDEERLMLLKPDKTVAPPVLRAADFRDGYPARQDDFTIRWNSPEDSSGIAGYSYAWGMDPLQEPEEELQMLDRNRNITVNVEEDGIWYFQVIAQDYAGNWSEPAVIRLNRDTTPPGPVVFVEPELDENGTLLSNTTSIGWLPPEDDDVAGYSYTLQYLGWWTYDGDTDGFNYRTPSVSPSLDKPEYSFYNMDNGMWGISVRAIDLVGNAGEPRNFIFRLNKYIPVTYITAIDSDKDDLGNITLEITGRGFSVGGEVGQMILDRDGQEPYDYVFMLENELYSVETDRIISGPVLEDIDTGVYRIGLIHPTRGLYFTRSGISIESSGTVKFGDFASVPETSWTIAPEGRFRIPFKYIIAGLVMLLLVFLFVFTVQRTAALVTEARHLQQQAIALIEGGPVTADERKKRVAQMSKIRMGLRFKFVLMITVLILLIVAMISIPVFIVTSRSQQEILASGLEDRAEVLIESIASGARTFLPADNILELSTLPSQMSALGEDAVFVTITSAGDPELDNYDSESYDYVWVTNDEQLPAEQVRTTGQYLMTDSIAGIVPALRTSINEQAEAKVGFIVEEISRLNEQVNPLVESFIRTGNAEDEEAINQIQEELRSLDEELNKRLYDIGNRTASFPVYKTEELSDENTNYTFYKPIVFRSQDDDTYFKGIVRLGISTKQILEKISESQQQLIRIISLIAAAAIGLGIGGALLLAALIIRPINKLVRGVEIIRDTEDKEALKAHSIKVGTRDELAVLAETVNQMTEGLVEAASANKLLTVGKEVQKKFIPLKEDSLGNKLSTGMEENDDISFFGYYEGARGVSGDYFDFRKIDDEHYAVIKCDVAGKGGSRLADHG